MKTTNQLRFMLSLLISLSCNVFAQGQFSSTKLNIKLTSGYDDNPLKMSKLSKSITQETFLETFSSDLSSRYNWSKSTFTDIELNGDYTVFPRNSDYNDWNLNGDINTIVKLYPKYKKSFIPGVYLNFGLDAYLADKYYTDRMLGEEYETALPFGNSLKLGDLLDKFSLDLFTGIRLKFNNSVNLLVQYQHNFNDYKDFGSMDNDSFVALDNAENIIKAILLIDIFNNADLQLKYSYNNRKYDYKTAKNLDKIEFKNKNREYVYHTYGIKFGYKYEKIKLSFSYSIRNRVDQFEGYYDYGYTGYKLNVYYKLSKKIKLSTGYSISQKDYDYLTFSKELLSNEYKLLKFVFSYKFYDNFSIAPTYIYDFEESSYNKFSFNRNLIVIKFEYKVL